MLIIIAPIVALLLVLFFIYLICRNELVYKFRMKTLYDKTFSEKERLERFRKLPSHDKMFWQFWKNDWQDYFENKK
jgi:hypothetical protein